jgi:hypothetical protein
MRSYSLDAVNALWLEQIATTENRSASNYLNRLLKILKQQQQQQQSDAPPPPLTLPEPSPAKPQPSAAPQHSHLA